MSREHPAFLLSTAEVLLIYWRHNIAHAKLLCYVKMNVNKRLKNCDKMTMRRSYFSAVGFGFVVFCFVCVFVGFFLAIRTNFTF